MLKAIFMPPKRWHVWAKNLLSVKGNWFEVGSSKTLGGYTCLRKAKKRATPLARWWVYEIRESE